MIALALLPSGSSTKEDCLGGWTSNYSCAHNLSSGYGHHGSVMASLRMMMMGSTSAKKPSPLVVAAVRSTIWWVLRKG